jgi:hypothetical protein
LIFDRNRERFLSFVPNKLLDASLATSLRLLDQLCPERWQSLVAGFLCGIFWQTVVFEKVQAGRRSHLACMASGEES